MAGDFVTRHREDKRLCVAFARNCDLYDRAFGTLEHVRYIASGEAICGLVINLDDDVARANAGIVSWCANVGSHDNGVDLGGRRIIKKKIIISRLVFMQEGETADLKRSWMRGRRSGSVW